jgi:Na+-transporting methylmalonyl-CoA/oxaloacetate decarboxylase gamma subunit
MALFTKGLLISAVGLVGVFLVLGLFFATIKLMQKISDK